MVLVCGRAVMVFGMTVIGIDVRVQRGESAAGDHHRRCAQDRYEATHHASVRDAEPTVKHAWRSFQWKILKPPSRRATTAGKLQTGTPG